MKANNERLYGQLDISTTRILELPIDDVPREILAIARNSEDTDIIERDNDSYVPNEQENGESCTLLISDFRL